MEAAASHENGNAIVAFDQTQTDMKELEEAIEKTGYSVTDRKE